MVVVVVRFKRSLAFLGSPLRRHRSSTNHVINRQNVNYVWRINGVGRGGELSRQEIVVQKEAA